MATNKNNDTTALSKVRYDKNNFEGYVTDMKAALRLHPDKLDTVMTKGSLNSFWWGRLDLIFARPPPLPGTPGMAPPCTRARG